MWKRWLMVVLLVGPLTAGTLQYAPDLRSDSGRRAWLGLVNPGSRALSAQVTAYAADGTALGHVTVSLNPYASWEVAAEDLVDGAAPAWATVASEDLPYGYVRFAGTGTSWAASAPLSRVSGGDLWVPQPDAPVDGVAASVVLVNTSDQMGAALSEPSRVAGTGKRGSHVVRLGDAEDGAVVPDFGAPFAQGVLDYASVFAKPAELTWDHLTSTDLTLAGMMRLDGVGANASRGAAFTLPRTPSQRLVAVLQQPLQVGMWSKLVLVNTNTVTLRVDVTPHYSWYGTPPHDYTYQTQAFTLSLAPGERRVLDIDKPTQQEIPAVADWYDIQSYESGLLGYQLFGTQDGTALAAVEAAHQPGSRRVLPYTPAGDDLTTAVTITNTVEALGRARVLGYAADGTLVRNQLVGDLRPYEKRTLTTQALFGADAARVAWCIVLNSNGHLSAASATYRGDNATLSALSGMPLVATTDEPLYAADMERFTLDDLRGQGWQEVQFTDAGEMVYTQSWESANGDMVKPGEFWIENAFTDADDAGYFYLGYEPFHSNNWAARAYGITERVAMVSPLIEIPQYGSWYLNYRMRFHNPLDAREESRYGMMWREEGSDTWYWFGVSGRHLLHPDAALGDCWVDIQWRNLDITVTPWFSFEAPLPAETAGKRIQVAYYYDHQPTSPNDTSPWMFIDRVHIQPTPLPHSLFYADWGEGVLTPEDLARTDDNFPLPPPAH